MTLLDRERAWLRKRRFLRWDLRGGPSRGAVWAHEHPLLITGVVASAFAALAWGLYLWTSELPARIVAWSVPFTAWAWWNVRTDAELAEEWRRSDRPVVATRDEEAEPPSGLLERMDGRNQMRAEEENQFARMGDPNDLFGTTSPVTNRYFFVRAAVAVGGLLVVGVIAAARAIFGS